MNVDKNETNERTHYAKSSSSISFRSNLSDSTASPEKKKKKRKAAEQLAQRAHHPSRIVSTRPLQILKCLHHAISGSINKRGPIFRSALRVIDIVYRYSSLIIKSTTMTSRDFSLDDIFEPDHVCREHIWSTLIQSVHKFLSQS